MSITTEVNVRVALLHELVTKIFGLNFQTKNPTVITVCSMNDAEDGQWLLHHPGYDKKALARRLRLAADIIEKADGRPNILLPN